jgi:hypothetical protein
VASALAVAWTGFAGLAAADEEAALAEAATGFNTTGLEFPDEMALINIAHSSSRQPIFTDSFIDRFRVCERFVEPRFFLIFQPRTWLDACSYMCGSATCMYTVT